MSRVLGQSRARRSIVGVKKLPGRRGGASLRRGAVSESIRPLRLPTQITDMLRIEGWGVNHKRVERIWRQEGLKVPQTAA